MEENNQSPWIPWQQDVENQAWFQYDWNLRNGDLISQTAYPGRAQFSEWSQQMIATMYQNWYNSAPEQMKRAMQAGINPFVAASGIAGAGVGSVASASPSSNPQLPQMLSAAGNLVGSATGAFGNVANGIIGLSKLKHEIRNIDADTSKMFTDMGFTNLQSKAMATQLKYMDSKEQIGVWQALATFDKTKQEYNNLKAQHSNLIKEYDEIIARIDLLKAEKGEVEALKLVHDATVQKLDAESKWQGIENDFFQSHGYKLGTPIYESLRDMMISAGEFNLETFGDVVSGYESKVQGAVEDARQGAIEKHTFAISHAHANGKNASDTLYGRIGSTMDFVGRLSAMGTNFLGQLGNKANNLFKSGKAKDIRNDLRMILDNAYDQLDKYPEDAKRINAIIEEANAALMLSNSELVEWWKKSNK